MDVSFALFYVVYAFVFNWAYDAIFPLPEWQKEAAASNCFRAYRIGIVRKNAAHRMMSRR